MTDPSPDENSGTRIPDRPDFPVDWEDDIEPTLLWSWDNFHSPLPRTPMTQAVSRITRPGFSQAAKDTGIYRPGGRSKVVNGYPYGASTAPPMTDEEQSRREEILAAETVTVRENWDKKWLPELKADLARFKAISHAELSNVELWETLEEILEHHTHHWNIHHRVVMPVIEQSNRLDRLVDEILGTEDESVAAVLLHGAETLTVSSIKRLEALAENARSDEELCETLRPDSSPSDITAALESFEAGRDWLKQLYNYLFEYGYRCAGFDLSFPTWVEDQTFAFQIVRNLLQNHDGSAPTAETRKRQLDQERDDLLAKVRRAAEDRRELLEKFENEFALGQQTWPLKEDHSHYIDQASTAVVRITIAEIGRRLQASGAIADADDIWYLELDEAKTAVLGSNADDLQASIVERRALREKFSKITPPKYVGTFPPDHEGETEPERPTESGGTLRGTAASKGEAAGIARVVLSPDDFNKVRKGDVLVCRSTAPMWTPLFSIISALVSEAGGVLSHPAVVAREFKLPAVVGVPNATDLIADGHPITVSGTDGLVHTN